MAVWQIIVVFICSQAWPFIAFKFASDVSPWPWPCAQVLSIGLGLVGLRSVALALRPLNACIIRCIVTDAHDSNYHVGNVNKILHANNFYLVTVFLLLSEGFWAPWLFIWAHSCCSCQLGSGRASFVSKGGLIVRPIVWKYRTNFLSHWFLPSVHWEMPFKLFTYSVRATSIHIQ